MVSTCPFAPPLPPVKAVPVLFPARLSTGTGPAAPGGTGKAVPPGVTRKSGALVRPVLTPVPLLCMQLDRRHTHNRILREIGGDRHSPCHMLEGSRFLATSHTRPRLDMH